MNSNESEKLAALIQEVKDMKVQLQKNTNDTVAIRSVVDNLSGGKQALLWLLGFLATVGIVIATILGLHK